MKIWLHRSNKCFAPSDSAAEAMLAQMEQGEAAIFEIVRPRSVAWNRMYWGICRAIGQNQDPERTEDSIDQELRVLSGHFEVMHVDGHEVRIPARLAFNKMTGDEWAEYWAKAETAIAERWGDTYLTEFGAA